MNTMDITEGQGGLIRAWYQEMPPNPDQYRIILRISVMFNHFCNNGSNGVDHNMYLSDLPRQSTAAKLFNRASILHTSLFRMTCEALKHHEFDKTAHPPPNSCLFRKIAWIIHPGYEFNTERESSIAFITQSHSEMLEQRLLLAVQVSKLRHHQPALLR